MKQSISFNDFVDGFSESYKNNFSYEGKQALYNYLGEYEEGTGKEIEFDPIALCCEYTEYENLKELQENYNDIKTMKDLEEHTQVIKIHNIDGTKSERFIIQDY